MPTATSVSACNSVLISWGGGGRPFFFACCRAGSRNAQTEPDWVKDHPALIVVPNAVLINWQRELAHFAPSLKVNAYHGYARSHENLTAHDIVLTTYGTLRTSCKKLNCLTYRLIAADEAQSLKNHNAQTVKALKSLKGQSYIALTGTPVENRLAEYWSIMDFVNPGLLGNLTSFQREISSPIERHRDPLAIDRFQRITGPFILRRLKTDRNIIADLPDKFTKDEYCELTPAQASLYQAVLDSIMAQIRGVDDVHAFERSTLVLRLINSLKQICNSPVQYLRSAELEDQVKGTSEDYGMKDSGKVLHLLDLASELLDGRHKALIFTQYTGMGELLQQWFKSELKLDLPFIRGQQTPQQRQVLVDRFQNDPDYKTPFLLLSLKAGGTGLNLTAAEAVIHFDLWWNPAVEEQATDRAYRIGQTKNVQVYRFITANTFEEKINAIMQQKRDLADLTVVSGTKWLGEPSNTELYDLFSLTRANLGLEE